MNHAAHVPSTFTATRKEVSTARNVDSRNEPFDQVLSPSRLAHRSNAVDYHVCMEAFVWWSTIEPVVTVQPVSRESFANLTLTSAIHLHVTMEVLASINHKDTCVAVHQATRGSTVKTKSQTVIGMEPVQIEPCVKICQDLANSTAFVALDTRVQCVMSQ